MTAAQNGVERIRRPFYVCACTEDGLLADIILEKSDCSLLVRCGPWAVVSVLPLDYCSGWKYVPFCCFLLTLLALPRLAVLIVRWLC